MEPVLLVLLQTSSAWEFTSSWGSLWPVTDRCEHLKNCFPRLEWGQLWGMTHSRPPLWDQARLLSAWDLTWAQTLAGLPPWPPTCFSHSLVSSLINYLHTNPWLRVGFLGNLTAGRMLFIFFPFSNSPSLLKYSCFALLDHNTEHLIISLQHGSAYTAGQALFIGCEDRCSILLPYLFRKILF